jgi:hypothetical protein
MATVIVTANQKCENDKKMYNKIAVNQMQAAKN